LNPDPDLQPWRQVAAAVARRKEIRRRRLEKARRTGALFECGCCFDAECPLYEVKRRQSFFRIPGAGVGHTEMNYFPRPVLDFDREIGTGTELWGALLRYLKMEKFEF
jgi:hypothetical protein